jgi:hypothetical protein
MKKMVCEMCGGNDLLKEEGVFVCQSCGTKYSVEDAKRMMVEIDGLVDVSGSTVKVDNSAKMENLYKLARRAKEDGNSEKAAQYYEQISLENPHDWEASFYTTFYSAIQNWKNDKENTAIDLLHNCIDSIVSIINDNVGDIAEKQAAVSTLVGELDSVCSAFSKANEERFDAFWHQFQSNRDYSYSDNEQLIVSRLQHASHINMGLSEIYYALGIAIVKKLEADLDDVAIKAIEKAITYVGDDPCEFVYRSYGADSLFRETYMLRKAVEEDTNNLIDLFSEGLEFANKKTLEKRVNAYWATHQDEKAALESEKESLLEKIAVINEEIPTIPQKTEGYSEMLELKKRVENLTVEKNAIDSTAEIVERNQRIEQLKAEKKALGLFDSKGKKPIKEQIAATEKEIASIKESMAAAIQEKIDAANNEIAPIQAKISQGIKNMNDMISTHRARLEAIDAELTMPR